MLAFHQTSDILEVFVVPLNVPGSPSIASAAVDSFMPFCTIWLDCVALSKLVSETIHHIHFLKVFNSCTYFVNRKQNPVTCKLNQISLKYE